MHDCDRFITDATFSGIPASMRRPAPNSKSEIVVVQAADEGKVKTVLLFVSQGSLDTQLILNSF